MTRRDAIRTSGAVLMIGIAGCFDDRDDDPIDYRNSESVTVTPQDIEELDDGSE